MAKQTISPFPNDLEAPQNQVLKVTNLNKTHRRASKEFRQEPIITEEEVPLRLQYNNQWYSFPYNEPVFVPIEAVHLWFGDHNILDIPPHFHRTEQLTHLRQYYGAYYDDQLWEINKPNVSVETVMGEPFITLLDDPEGDLISPATMTKDQNALILQRLDAIETENKALKQILDQTPPGTVSQKAPVDGEG